MRRLGVPPWRSSLSVAAQSNIPAVALTEDAARECSTPKLEDALQLVHLYFERGSPKAEPAARRWLIRYLTEGTPSVRDVAKVTATLYATNPPRWLAVVIENLVL